MILHNHAQADFEVTTGQRIAQLVICRLVDVDVTESADDAPVSFAPGERGARGFGSTGTHKITVSNNLT